MGAAAAAVILSLAVLVWGADRFVDGAAALARNLGISPLVIGLVLVGFGTSAPEMLVSAIAAWQGNPGIAVGNAVGSNITNVALILGVTALVYPLNVHSRLLRRELPILLTAMLIAVAMLLDGELDRIDGALLLTGFVLHVYWTLRVARRGGDGVDALDEEFTRELPEATMSNARAIFWSAFGLVLLLASARLLVWGAVVIAEGLGVSDLVIGLTVVAVGTSLPELAAAIAAARKGEDDIALGNVVGSNTFNILAVLGLPGLIRPGPFEPALLWRDFPIMVGLTLAMFLMAWGVRGPGRINRIEASVLLLCFVAYQVLLYG